MDTIKIGLKRSEYWRVTVNVSDMLEWYAAEYEDKPPIDVANKSEVAKWAAEYAGSQTLYQHGKLDAADNEATCYEDGTYFVTLNTDNKKEVTV